MIVWISDCPEAPGGFAKVSYHMIKALQRAGYRVASVCFGRMLIGEHDGIRVYPYTRPPFHLFDRIKRDFKEDIELIVVHGAPWVPPFKQVLPEIKAQKGRAKMLGYFVHEAMFMPTEHRRMFFVGDHLITPTKYTAEVLRATNYSVVPHGIDPKVWKPLDEPKFGTFTIAMVAKNHPRKRWDLFFEVVGRLLKEGYDVQALAWTQTNGFWQIPQLVETVEHRLGVKLRVVLPKPYDSTFGVDDRELAKILSQAHVHLEMTMGEAWGLPITETLALGLPNVAVDYQAIREWAGDKVTYLQSSDYYYSVDGLLHPVPSVDDAVEKIKDIIDNYEKHSRRAKEASRKIRRNMTWKKAGEKMVKLVEKFL